MQAQFKLLFIIVVIIIMIMIMIMIIYFSQSSWDNNIINLITSSNRRLKSVFEFWWVWCVTKAKILGTSICAWAVG